MVRRALVGLVAVGVVAMAIGAEAAGQAGPAPQGSTAVVCASKVGERQICAEP